MTQYLHREHIQSKSPKPMSSSEPDSSDDTFFSSFFSSTAAAAESPPPPPPPAAAAPPPPPPPPAGMEAIFAEPAAMRSAMDFPSHWLTTKEALSSSYPTPTLSRMVLRSFVVGLSLPPRAARRYAAT